MLRRVLLRSRWLWACGVVGCGIGLWMGSLISQDQVAPTNPVVAEPIPTAPAVTREQLVEVGGVLRPATDVMVIPNEAAGLDVKTPDVGRTPAIPRDANPHVQSIVEARESQRFPERLTDAVAPTPFDEQAYRANPQAYLDVIEPGRIWQSKQPGEGVPRITALVGQVFDVQQGDSVPLRVQVVPGAPVTFTSFDLGAFENQLTSITVAADENGVAETLFIATPGTVETVSLVAASPLTSGQVEFFAQVALRPGPEPVAEVKR